MNSDRKRNEVFLLQISGFIVVASTMIEMFTVPRSYFILGSIVSTSSMACVAYLLSYQTGNKFRAGLWRVGIGVAVAFFLYLIFLGGNYAVVHFKLLGVSATNEKSIYGLFSGTSTPLLVFVLALDAIGFESYFRGNLQGLFSKKIGIGSVFLVALIDAVIHLSTFNSLFPVTVVVADSIWGLNYYATKNLYSNILSHFLWDLLIFVLLPIH